MSRREPHGEPPAAGIAMVSHSGAPPKWMVRAILAMAAALLATLAALGFIGVYVYQANQYVQGRGEWRDQEQDRLEQQITDGICDLLEQLPAGPLLDEVRAKYGCGPGLPPEAFSPEVQEQLAGRPEPRLTSPDPEEGDRQRPPLGSAAVPDPPRAVPGTPPTPTRAPEPAPEPSPGPGPLVDPSPVTDLVCGLVDVCRQETP